MHSFLLIVAAFAAAQTVEVPIQPNGGLPGGQAGVAGGGSAAGFGSSQQLQSVDLNGGINIYSTPQLDPSLSPTGASALPLESAVVPSFEARAVGPVQGPTALTGNILQSAKLEAKLAAAPSSALAAPGIAGKRTATAEGLIQGAGKLAETKKLQESGKASDGADYDDLQQFFDAMRRSQNGQGASGGDAVVKGASVDVGKAILETVRIANGESAHDAPGLYESAVKTAKEALTPSLAEAAVNLIMRSADKKAQWAFPSLTEEIREASRQLASGGAPGESAVAERSAKLVDKAFKSFERWQSLFTKAGQPQQLISNFSHLKSFVQDALARKQSLPKIGFVRSPAEARIGKASGAPGESASPGVSYMAELPPDAVALINRDLAQDYDLRLAGSAPGESAASVEDEAIEAFRKNPSAANGFKLIYGANIAAGNTGAGSFFAAAYYWLKTVAYGLWRKASEAWSDWSRVPPDAFRLETFKALDQEYLAASIHFSQQASVGLDLRSARAMLSRAKRMAGAFAELTGDGQPAKALERLGKSVERQAGSLGLEDADRLPAGVVVMIASRQGNSIRYWMDRMHDRASKRAEESGVRANAYAVREVRPAPRPLSTVSKAPNGPTSFQGLSASLGRGRLVTARITFDKKKAESGGFILAAPESSRDDYRAIRVSEAVLAASGGMMSHAVLLARELGLPSLLVSQADLGRLREGDVVTVDAEQGILRVYPEAEQSSRLSLAEALRAFDGLRDGSALAQWFEGQASADHGAPGESAARRLAPWLLEEMIGRALAGNAEIADLIKVRRAVFTVDHSGILKTHETRFWARELRLILEFLTATEQSIGRAKTRRAVSNLHGRAQARVEKFKAVGLALGQIKNAQLVSGLSKRLGDAADRRLRSLGQVQAGPAEAVAGAGAFIPKSLRLDGMMYANFIRANGLESKMRDLSSDASLSLAAKARRIRTLIMAGRHQGFSEELPPAGDFLVMGPALSLHAKRAELGETVKQVWAALWSAKALGQRLREGRALADEDAVVFIQEIVKVGAPGESVSGSVLTRDASSGSRSRLVVGAVPGNLIGMAQAQALPSDQYVVNPKTGAELLPAILGGPKALLTPGQLRRLTRAAQALEDHFGYGVEIWYSFAGDKLFIIQVRPLSRPS